ncbi:MAG: caspase family protein [Planctomycetia bacterium]|nr:caspase family protein [Planctomycetia bacterium]
MKTTDFRHKNRTKFVSLCLLSGVLLLSCFHNTFGADMSSDSWKPVASKGKWYVLLFAVNHFDQCDRLSDLAGCYNDMEYAKENWLDKRTNKKLVFLNDVDGTIAPTRNVFLAELNRIKKRSGPDDIVLIMISTHGVAFGQKSFICPSDARSIDFSDVNPTDAQAVLSRGDRNGLISITNLLQNIREIDAAGKYIVLDACRPDEAGSSGDFLREFEDTLRKNNDNNLAVITSCSLNQMALEARFTTRDGTSKTYGIFMKNFIDGLSGKADLTGAYDGKITLIEAYNYANSMTRRNNPNQTPELYEAFKAVAKDDGRQETDRQVAANRTIFATYEEIPFDESQAESNLQFAMRTGANLARAAESDEDHHLSVDICNYVVDKQPHNMLAYGVRGYAWRSLGDYAKSLCDCQRTGGELVLFAKARPAKSGAYVYATPYATSPVLDEEKKQIFPTGTKLTIDDVQNNRLHVRLWNDKEPRFSCWVNQEEVSWTPELAQQSINGTSVSSARSLAPASHFTSMAPTSVRNPTGRPSGGGGSFRTLSPLSR